MKYKHVLALSTLFIGAEQGKIIILRVLFI